MRYFSPFATTAIVLLFSLSQFQTEAKIRPAVTALPSDTPAKVSSLGPSAYYSTPMGVTFSGADRDEKFDGDFAFAPVNTWLETKAETSGGSFEWKYSTGENPDGSESFQTSKSESLSFRSRQKGTCSAPLLTVKGSLKSASYTLAKDGINYGEIGSDTHFAVNYQPGMTTEFSIAPEVLNVNDTDAQNYLNLIMAMGGSIFSDIEILGFAESFYDCGDFYLQAVSAEIYCETTPTVDDIAVKVFKREMQSVYTDEIAQLETSDIYNMGNNRYYVTFRCDDPAYITTALQVVVMPAEGSSIQFSPVLPLQSYYAPSNAGTASFYSNFKFSGKPAKKQYMDFFGTEVSDDNDKVVGYLNHWAIGIKGSYEKPESGIDEISADQAVAIDNNVYSISGMRVATIDNIADLPAGIYISNGKKIIIR